MSARCCFVTVLLWASAAIASPVVLDVDPAQSSVTVTLTMTIGSTQWDSDTSPVDGWSVISLDCLTDPQSMRLHDFDFILTQTIDLSLNFGLFVGQFNAVGTNIELLYADPGNPMPPTAIGPGGEFAYVGVPVDADGELTYSATMLICIAFGTAGYPCEDTMDLSTLNLYPFDMNGVVQVQGRDVTLTQDIDVSGPLDPLNPDLGVLSIVGTIVAEGTVPPPDLSTFIGVLLGEVTETDLVCESDMDGNGVVNGLDIQPYVEALLTP